MKLSSTTFVWLLGWTAAVTTVPLAAHAGEGRVLKIAVLEVKAVGTFDPKTVAGLGALIATEAGRYPAKVVAGADLLALIGFDKQKQLLGCTDDSCLAQIGGALGVDFLLTSEVAAVGDRWLLTTTLLDAAKASALARSTKQAKSPGDLVDLVPAAIAETLAIPALARAATPAPAPAPTETPAPTPAPAPAVQAKAPTGSLKPQRVAGFALIGVGAGALIGGVIAGALADKQHSDIQAGRASRTQEELDAARSGIDQKLWAADGLFIAAAVVAATGLVLALTAPSSGATPPPASAGLAPVPGGGALFVSGGF